MIGRRSCQALVALLVLVSTSPALAEKRLALVVGNSAYANVSPLENPKNDAVLMASTLKSLGFTLIGDGPQLDLDKVGLDLAIQKFSAGLPGSDVGMFYYAGHGVQVRGSNFLVPVNANPTREADVDFQMVDVNLVLRQMESAGTKLNLVILDACRNNPFGGRGLRSSDSGLAQMRAPEGTLISFATQPGNVAADGADGNSPYTKALATTIRRDGLDIFQTFNEVGLAVKRSTGGTQQPWVSSSPIDGKFYFASPPVPVAAPAGTDSAAQAWAATRDSSSIAVIETFIQQYGDSIYAPFARARRDELKNNQVALAAPKPPAPRSHIPRVSRAETTRLFEPLVKSFDMAERFYLQKPESRDLYQAASRAILRAYPPSSPSDASASDSQDGLYRTAETILNEKATSEDDSRVVEAGINGALASLDPHSSYMNAAQFKDLQVVARGVFGGVGMEVTMENGIVKVVSPIEDTPASRAGILANDLISSIDDASLQGLSLNEVVGKLRGTVGTPVKLKIVRPKVEKPIEITIVRASITVRAVRSRIESDNIGYIRISTFNEQTSEALKKAFEDISKQVANNNLKGYVIDLRNNPGGLLTQAVEVSDTFLNKGDITSVRGRVANDNQKYTAKQGDLSNGKRLVVLINGGSASASEIVASALKENGRATVLGTRSFGKGSVQTIIPLGGDLGAVRLTTAQYLTPSGVSIQTKGVIPDMEILQDEPDDVKGKPQANPGSMLPPSQAYIPPDPKNDKALRKAVELLQAPPAPAPARAKAK